LFSEFNPGNMIQGRGKQMARGISSPPSFELSMARKDLRLMVEESGAPSRHARRPAGGRLALRSLHRRRTRKRGRGRVGSGERVNPLYLTEGDVVATLSVRDALTLVEDAARALATGNAQNGLASGAYTTSSVIQVLAAAYGGRMGHKTYTVRAEGARLPAFGCSSSPMTANCSRCSKRCARPDPDRRGVGRGDALSRP